MGNLISKTRIILVGCGPHAKRVYLPALHQLQHIELALIIDLESQEHSIRAAVKDSPSIELWFIKPFSEGIPVDLAQRISAFVF